MSDVIIVTILVLFFLPVTIYGSVKLGAYGFYKGRELFEREGKEDASN